MDEIESTKSSARLRDARIILALGILTLLTLGLFVFFIGGVPLFIGVPSIFVGCGFIYLGWRKRCMVCSALSSISGKD